MGSKSKVAIILINYNSYSDTVECVKSLKQINDCNFDIFIVDNASEDANKLQNDAFLNENTTILYSENNGGFSYGNNIGMKYAASHDIDYFLLLNNDTVVEPDFLSKLIDCAEGKQDCGLVTGQSRYYNNRMEANFRGGFFNYITGCPEYYDTHDESLIRDEITFATGCMFLIPKNTLAKIGYLDESYFMYGEDTDFCLRILNAGLRIYYCDDAIIYHKISASAGYGSNFQTYYMLRNGLFIIKKYGKSKVYAYVRQLYLSIKLIKNKNYLWKSVKSAWMDFVMGKVGKADF